MFTFLLKNRKKIIAISIFLSLLAYCFFILGSNQTSVIPGWHTSILPPNYRLFFENYLIQILVLFLSVIGYWLIDFKKPRLNTILIFIHLFITIIFLALINFPLLGISNKNLKDPNYLDALLKRINLNFIVFNIFTAIQLIMMIYIIYLLFKQKKANI